MFELCDVPVVFLIEEPDLPIIQRNTAGPLPRGFRVRAQGWPCPDGARRRATPAHPVRGRRTTMSVRHRISPPGGEWRRALSRPPALIPALRRHPGRCHDRSVSIQTNSIRENLVEPSAEQTEDFIGRVGHVHLHAGDVATAPPLGRHPGPRDDRKRARRTFRPGWRPPPPRRGQHREEQPGRRPARRRLSLGTMTIQEPDTPALDALEKRLRDRALRFSHDGRELIVSDPCERGSLSPRLNQPSKSCWPADAANSSESLTIKTKENTADQNQRAADPARHADRTNPESSTSSTGSTRKSSTPPARPYSPATNRRRNQASYFCGSHHATVTTRLFVPSALPKTVEKTVELARHSSTVFCTTIRSAGVQR